MTPKSLLLKLARQHPVSIGSTVFLGFLTALLHGASTALVVPFLLGLVRQDFTLRGVPPFLQAIINFYGNGFGLGELWAAGIAIFSTLVLKHISAYSNALISQNLSRSLAITIRKDAVHLLLNVDLDFYTKNSVGSTINLTNSEALRATQALKVTIEIVTAAITVAVFLGLLFSISIPLTLLAGVLLGGLAIINQKLIAKVGWLGEKLSYANQNYSVSLQELLQGIRLIKTSANEEREFQKLENIFQEKEQIDYRTTATYAIIPPLNEVAGVIAFVAIAIIGSQLFRDRLATLAPMILTYLVLLFRLLPIVGQLNGLRSKFANSYPSVCRVADFLNRENKPFRQSGSLRFDGVSRGIRFEGLSFSYPGHDRTVLKAIDLWVPRGQTLALVGASGAGKSTIADLLPRFYDPTDGRITIDDRDLRDYDLKSLRRAMGIVSQQTYLFNDSVRNNIAYGIDRATEEQIIDAAKRANAYEFILQLPKGFDTPIGDRGILLSGGQRQRLAIARALLRDPDILILDEATSALDTVSETLVQQALEELRRDRTTLAIAHRLSTVQNADLIAVLDGGCIIELGRHDELLARDGYYKKLYQMQFSLDSHDLIHQTRNQAMATASYTIRSRLNPVVGFLNLLLDEIIDMPQERSELLQEAYQSTMRLLDTLEEMERKAKKAEQSHLESS